ncbi:MAG TPA: polysaccharide biosynthesis tyrosine autokinase [Thermoanaerobaculia bacterium]|nr:polysaccharide biosynthesis tyrosine autokinase [Thermoanaerobaculia bacterium]
MGRFADEPDTASTAAEYWAILVKNRLLIILCALAGTAVALLVSVFSAPRYRAAVILNVERDAGRLFEVTTDGQGYGIGDPAFLATQVRLMRSREVAERVITRLNLLGHPDVSTAKSGFFRQLTKNPRAGNSGDLAAAAVRIQNSVTAAPLAGTNLVELAYVGGDPKVTADVANALAEAYIDWSAEAKFQVVGQASRFLGTQIEQLKSDMEQKEAQLHSYGQEKDIVSVDPRANVTLQKLEMLNHDYADAVSDRVAKEARNYELQSSTKESVVAASDPAVAQLRADLGHLQQSYDEKLQMFKPEWPAMKQLKYQIDNTRTALANAVNAAAGKVREDARRELVTAQRREQSAHDELEAQKREAMQLNGNAVEFNNLRNEIETKRSLLESLQKRLAETEVTARLRGEHVATVRVVDRALVPAKPFVPSYPSNLWNGLVVGLMVGFVLAVGRDLMYRSLHTVEEVEKYLRLPALGVVPTIGRIQGYGYGYGGRRKKESKKTGDSADTPKIELVPHLHPRSAIAEAYRAIRTSLLLSQAGGVKSMVITSCLPREGKTSTALNLAVTLAQLQKRVLLIDADLHKPRVHEALRLSNRVGLVSILVDNVEPMKTIQQTQVPNLSAVTSGPTSPNPSGLLSSELMKRFLQYAIAHFDCVVLDSPPAESVADALIIGNLTDGVVLCVEGSVTPRESVIRLRNRLIQSNVNVLGVVINKFRQVGPGYGKSYQYYGSPGYTTDLPATERSAASS